MNTLKTLRALALLCVIVPGAASAIPIARLTLDSEVGDFIGGGGQFDILYDSVGDAVSAQVRRRLPDGSPAELLWVLNSPRPGNQFALVFFGTDALGIPIQPGVYTDAERADFADPGHPGLDISFQNRGLNTLTGSFEILSVEFSNDPLGFEDVVAFSATFEQRSSAGAPALFGRFDFNINGFSVLPEPAPLALMVGGLVLCMALRRRSRLKAA